VYIPQPKNAAGGGGGSPLGERNTGNALNTGIAENQYYSSDEVVIDDKLGGQLDERGWTEQGVQDLAKTSPTGTSRDERGANKTSDGQKRNDPATVYGPKTGGHIVVNDRTRELAQISNRLKPWIPDSRIKWHGGN